MCYDICSSESNVSTARKNIIKNPNDIINSHVPPPQARLYLNRGHGFYRKWHAVYTFRATFEGHSAVGGPSIWQVESPLEYGYCCNNIRKCCVKFARRGIFPDCWIPPVHSLIRPDLLSDRTFGLHTDSIASSPLISPLRSVIIGMRK